MNSDVIEQHYRDNYRKLHKLMTFRSGTEWDAEDVLQEAYARAVKYISGWDGTRFEAWFRTILNNALREHKNSEKGFSYETFEEEDMGGTPCSNYNERVISEIYDLIDTKSPHTKEVLLMFFQKGYTARDISRITSYSYAASHQLIQRFRNELKEKYSG
jgi:RNA polymerase sigma factor (sigma-70 family)